MHKISIKAIMSQIYILMKSILKVSFIILYFWLNTIYMVKFLNNWFKLYIIFFLILKLFFLIFIFILNMNQFTILYFLINFPFFLINKEMYKQDNHI